MSLALSTSWNAFRHNSAGGLLAEIKNLGFDTLELSFSLMPSLVSDIALFTDKKEFKVVSVHNFCPIPDGVKIEEALPDYYPMSSLDESQRQQSLKYTKITIDTAHRLNAKAVVLHCGRVDIPGRTKELVKLFNQGQRDTKEYNELKAGILNERKRLYKPYLENTLRSLEELSRYAEKKNITLGIENRFYIREIPSFEEIGIILQEFKGSNLFYWHDTGHAQVMENLGLNKHKDYLDIFGNNMVGVHLHDCTATSDHQAPSQGEIDFAMLKPYIRKETLKVIEAHQPSSGEDLKKSKEFLETLFNGKL